MCIPEDVGRIFCLYLKMLEELFCLSVPEDAGRILFCLSVPADAGRILFCLSVPEDAGKILVCLFVPEDTGRIGLCLYLKILEGLFCFVNT